MTRLEVLKAEKEQIKGLRCLSFGLIDKCIEWYDKEIEAIVIHGADNKFYGQQADTYQTDLDEADGEYISREAVLKEAHEIVVDGERYDVVQVETIYGLPTVDIPQDHDGCKDCRWQSQSETEMPCKQCMHNYTDEWEMKRPDKIDIVKLCASEEYKQLEQYNISGNKYHLGFANACAWIMNKYREG